MSGIPEIRLIGSVSDWLKVQSKVQAMAKMDIELDFWLQYLVPIIENIVQTVRFLGEEQAQSSSAKLDSKLVAFWDSIYQFSNMSGGSCVSGWAKTLFPYTHDGKQNTELKWDYGEEFNWPNMGPGDFPASYSRCPMKWDYFDQTIDCGMYGGMFGVAQQKTSGCIAPVLGWIIAE
jgi:hypothetical protein